MSIEAETVSTEQAVQTEGTGIPKDPPAFDRAGLESKVADSLAAAFGEDDDSDEVIDDGEQQTEEAVTEDPPAEEATADETQSGQEESGEEQQTGEEEETPAAETEDAGAAAATKTTAPTLPAAYRRSLKAYEWTDEEIDANLKTFGTKFIETAGRIHKNRNAEIADWAERGRQARQAAQPQPQQGQQQQQQTAAPASGLKPVDAAALKQKYGSEDLIDEIVGPVNAAIEQINNTILPAVQQTQARSQQAEMDMLSRQIDGFFGGKELEPYRNVYGDPAKSKLTKEQIDTRNKVLEMADALVGGAERAIGRKLSFGEAMQMAHDHVSSGFKEQAVRTAIKSQLKTRNKGITLKPSGRSTTTANSGGAPKTRSDLERKVSQGLKAAFG
jgi:hypothetical protein